ncbi:hypothetical protein [Bartonella sp. ML70XJBT]|nr:hypothetical protein [Bartonella sp. ML70XJBT]
MSETTAYFASMKEEGISSEELFNVVSFIAANPNAGDLIQGMREEAKES